MTSFDETTRFTTWAAKPGEHHLGCPTRAAPYSPARMPEHESPSHPAISAQKRPAFWTKCPGKAQGVRANRILAAFAKRSLRSPRIPREIQKVLSELIPIAGNRCPEDACSKPKTGVADTSTRRCPVRTIWLGGIGHFYSTSAALEPCTEEHEVRRLIGFVGDGYATPTQTGIAHSLLSFSCSSSPTPWRMPVYVRSKLDRL